MNCVRVSILNYCQEKEKKIKYALNMLSLFLGVGLKIIEKDPEITIASPDFDAWKRSNVKVTYIEDIPVLYTREKPAFFIRNGKVGFDILAATFWLLSRQEEADSNHRDQWGNFRSSFSALDGLGLLYKPVINYWVKEIAEYIDRQLRIMRIPRWKDGKLFAAALTHDVDLVSLNSVKERLRVYKLIPHDGTDPKLKLSILGSPFYALLKGFQNRSPVNPCWHFEKWLRLEEKYNVKSTFFFFADGIKKKHPVDAFYRYGDKVVFDGRKMKAEEMIREIARAGWEIGLHGSYYSSQDLEELHAQKTQLEELLQEEVKNIRQHFLRFDVNLTPIVHEKNGFLSDTTLGFNRNIGFRAGVGYPFKLWHFQEQREITTWEIPLIIQDGALFQREFLDLNNLDLAFETCLRLVKEVEITGGLITLLWHPHTVADRFYPGWFRLYERLLEYLALRDCWLASIGEITNWWEERRKILYAA